ncbi:hypothetical protein, conserved [Eimeria necatrix]|uniref:Transmembrane protein n=1 Tax=Eimeria necatrix TaxID=51315 RepID=U6MID3_9EIME|nr:hypothetical protein, conserved [Eimeria necatrix]CDJ64002.1 hypothetical protein, conserved [Eimeria necatrix]
MHAPFLAQTSNPAGENAKRQAVIHSLLYTSGGTPDCFSTLEPQYTDQLWNNRGLGVRPKQPRRSLSLTAILASVASLVTVLAWLGSCYVRRNRAIGVGPTRRNLSELRNENNLSDILEECVSLEEELGISHDAPKLEEEEATTKARYFSMLHESAEAFERTPDQSSRTSQQVPTRFPESGSPQKADEAQSKNSLLLRPHGYWGAREEASELLPSISGGGAAPSLHPAGKPSVHGVPRERLPPGFGPLHQTTPQQLVPAETRSMLFTKDACGTYLNASAPDARTGMNPQVPFRRVQGYHEKGTSTFEDMPSKTSTFSSAAPTFYKAGEAAASSFSGGGAPNAGNESRCPGAVLEGASLPSGSQDPQEQARQEKTLEGSSGYSAYKGSDFANFSSHSQVGSSVSGPHGSAYANTTLQGILSFKPSLGTAMGGVTDYSANPDQNASKPVHNQEAAPLSSRFESGGKSASSRDLLSADTWVEELIHGIYPTGSQQMPQAEGNVATGLQDATKPVTTAAPAFKLGARTLLTTGSISDTSDVSRTSSGSASTPPLNNNLPPRSQEQRMYEVAYPGGGATDFSAPSNHSFSAPAVERTVADAGSHAAWDISLHPYVRLPVAQLQDAGGGFRRKFSLTKHPIERSPLPIYEAMRTLFAKAVLTPEESDLLLLQAERLVSYANTKLAMSSRLKSPYFIVRKLASLFVAFDYLVCTIEVLGDQMDTGSWWEPFAQSFDTDFTFPTSSMRTKKARERIKLANRLSAALSIYKKGVRPPLEEIVELKRTLFRKVREYTQFRHPLWLLWVHDDVYPFWLGNGAKDQPNSGGGG